MAVAIADVPWAGLSRWVIFAATYVVIARGKAPALRLDRAGAGLLGAALMTAVGAISTRDAYRAIDWNTITLLLGVMIVSAHLRISGFFALAAHGIARHLRGPKGFLAAVIAGAALASAFLVNDTACLMIAPLVIDIARRFERNPVPYLFGLAMAANIGSAATVTGNPQNIIIASYSGIGYAPFAAALAPVAAAGLVVCWLAIILACRDEFRRPWAAPAVLPRPRAHAMLVRRSLIVALAMIAGFFVVAPPAKPAIVAGALLLVSRGVKPERVWRAIDWPLLVMFAGLFIVTAAIRPDLDHAVGLAPTALQSIPVLAAVAAGLSNLISNVPAVLVLAPFVGHMPQADLAWLALAMASTFAGNLTLLGSVANLIVAEQASRRGIALGFRRHLLIGLPVTVATVAMGLFILLPK